VLLITGGSLRLRAGTKIDPPSWRTRGKGRFWLRGVVANGKVTPITPSRSESRKRRAAGIVKKVLVDYGDRVNEEDNFWAKIDKIRDEAQVEQSKPRESGRCKTCHQARRPIGTVRSDAAKVPDVPMRKVHTIVP